MGSQTVRVFSSFSLLHTSCRSRRDATSLLSVLGEIKGDFYGPVLLRLASQISRFRRFTKDEETQLHLAILIAFILSGTVLTLPWRNICGS